MKHLIDKDTLVAELEKRRRKNAGNKLNLAASFEDNYLLSFLDTLEVIDPYEQCVQYDSIKAGIQAQAETYSFNIESELFNQLTTEEQQALWKKEIEQAYVSGAEVGVELARDPRYKENIEVKDVDMKKELETLDSLLYDLDGVAVKGTTSYLTVENIKDIAKHFFELGLKTQKGQ